MLAMCTVVLLLLLNLPHVFSKPRVGQRMDSDYPPVKLKNHLCEGLEEASISSISCEAEETFDLETKESWHPPRKPLASLGSCKTCRIRPFFQGIGLSHLWFRTRKYLRDLLLDETLLSMCLKQDQMQAGYSWN